MPEEKFEAHVAHAVNIAVAAVEGDQKVLKAARAEKQAEKRARRQQREADLGAKIAAMPDKRYGVILADPPWALAPISSISSISSISPYSGETGMDRAAGNYYPTNEAPTSAAADVASKPARCTDNVDNDWKAGQAAPPDVASKPAPITGNDVDVEQSAEKRRRENTALDDDLSIPEGLLRKAGP